MRINRSQQFKAVQIPARIGNRKGMSAPGNTEWIPGYFDGEDVFVIGGGPSINQMPWEKLADKRTIGVNHSIRFIPNLDIACFIDHEFNGEMKRFYDQDMQNWPGKVVASHKSHLRAGGNVAIMDVTGNAADFSMKSIYGEYSSGIFAAQVAKLAGARRIYVCGMDCGWVDGEHHGHPVDSTGYSHRRGITGNKELDIKRERTYRSMVRHWERIDGPFIVVGKSRLTKWPQMRYEDVFR